MDRETPGECRIRATISKFYSFNPLTATPWQQTKGRIMTTKVTVETRVNAPVAEVWRAYTTPSDIQQWNTASDDWHTTKCAVDLRVGGIFSSRMEAKDGSFGFDFEGTYTKVIPHELLEFSFGDRAASVAFISGATGVTVRVVFDAESENPIEQQQQGWQAILNNFATFVQARQ